MRLGDWNNRLQTAIPDLRVKGAAELATAEIDQNQRDSCYLVLADDRAADNSLVGHAVRQIKTTGVCIVLAVRNHRSGAGAAAVAEIETRREQVQTALLGWSPPDSFGPVTYLRGRLLNFNAALLWWQDEYQVPVLITGVAECDAQGTVPTDLRLGLTPDVGTGHEADYYDGRRPTGNT